jgi:hypothetical protein
LPPDEVSPDEPPADELPPDELLDDVSTDEPPVPDPVEVVSVPLDEPLVVAPLVPPAPDVWLGGTKLVSQPSEGAIIAPAPVSAIPSHAKELKDRSAMDLPF